LLLVALLAVLSASEAALHTIRRPQLIEELAARGWRGRLAGTMGRKAIEYLAAIQVAEFFIVFAFAGIAAAFLAPRLSDLLRFLFGPAAPVIRDVAAVVVTGGVLSLAAVVTEEAIKALVETGEAQGVLHEGEQKMISSIFALAEKPVHEVMVPRTDMVGIDVATMPDQILDIITKVGHSRIPVFEGSADNIIGILYVKDVFRRLARGEKDVQLRQFLRPAQFVPETKKVDELLREMQRDKVHIAIVVDEYGGTAG